MKGSYKISCLVPLNASMWIQNLAKHIFQARRRARLLTVQRKRSKYIPVWSTMSHTRMRVMEVKLDSFLDRGKWTASRSGPLYQPSIYWIGEWLTETFVFTHVLTSLWVKNICEIWLSINLRNMKCYVYFSIYIDKCATLCTYLKHLFSG
jgi:hypothetical protein